MTSKTKDQNLRGIKGSVALNMRSRCGCLGRVICSTCDTFFTHCIYCTGIYLVGILDVDVELNSTLSNIIFRDSTYIL